MAVEDVRLRARPRSLAAQPARRRRSSAGQRWLFVLALVTFWLASSYTATATLNRIWPALFPGQTLSLNLGIVPELPIERIGITKPGANSVFNERINLLIVGLDRRPGDDEWAGRTDTIMVATVDPITKEASALSFPRDMLIDIYGPYGTWRDRINASYVAGFEDGDSPENGARQLVKDLKENFGITIDHWVIMDFRGVEQLIDAIGGVDVDIPIDLEVPEWYYSDDDVNARWVGPFAGPMHLDGYNAVAFGRYRNDSDFYRIKRQQTVMQAALAQSFTLGLLDNIPSLWNTYRDTVRTDIPFGKMAGYGALLKSTNGNLKTYSLGDPVNGVETVWGVTTDQGASVLEWDADNVRFWISQAFTPAKYAASSVEVQNGYAFGDEGEMRALGLGRYLKYVKGLPTVEYGGDAEMSAITQITLYDPAKRKLAEDIATWLQIPTQNIRVSEKTAETQPDVVIVVGQDFHLPES